MKLKITVGTLNQVEVLTPISQKTYSVSNITEVLKAFDSFFASHPELPIPQDAENIIQGGEVWTTAKILALKYFLKNAGLGFEFYMMDEGEDSILDDLTRGSGAILIDEAQSFFGFVPRGFYLKFASEEEANPINIYSWVGSKVKLFPSTGSDPYTTALEQTKEILRVTGTVSTPIIATFMKILAGFKKRIIII